MAAVPPDDVEENGCELERDAVDDDSGALSMSVVDPWARTEAVNGSAMSISNRVLRNSTTRSTRRMWSNPSS
jgi:hypothetical protein